MYPLESSTAHLPFVEAMAALPSESDPEWSALGAELLVLRAVDAWSQPWTTDDELAQQLDAVGQFVAASDVDEPTRLALHDVLRALRRSRSRHTALDEALLRHGRALERRARWELAGDVYHTLIALGRHAPRADKAGVEAWMRVAECHRQQAAWPAAAAAFDRASQLAEATGTPTTALRARCYAAAVTAERGNLPAADEALVALQVEASRSGDADAQAIVRHARAHVAFLRHDFELAARLAFEALGSLADPFERDRALADVAAAFAELGVRSAARDAHLVLSETAQDPIVRWTALINLMELASRDGKRDAFEQYRRTVGAEPLPPRLAGYFHLFAGAGARAFGDAESARAEFRQAIDIATHAGLAQLVFDAERSLRELDEHAPLAEPPSRAPSPRTAAIADALARMREQVLPDA